MRIKSEYEPIVLVGAWNKAMFTPDWVQKYVFPGIPMNIEFPLNNPLASIRYSANGIVFSTVESRLSFLAKKTNKDVFFNIGSLAKDLCRLLQHTPIQNFGINHVFELVEDEVKGIPDFEVITGSPFDGFVVNTGSIMRSMSIENSTLNFSLSKRPDGIFEANFNYHHNCSSIEDFLKSFDPDDINNKCIEAQELLAASFGFKMTE